MFHLPPPPGFQGFDPRKEVTIYQRHLPHWRQKGATYFVTFRLADSLPQSALQELRQLREDLMRRHFPKGGLEVDETAMKKHRLAWENVSHAMMAATEKWLDQGLGSCVLKSAEARKIVVDSLMEFDDIDYELGAFVVMPNHVHAIMRPFDDHAPEKILQRHKQWTSRQVNKRTGNSGSLWQQESYDRIIRDSEHLWRVLQYIGKNPSKAGIGEEDSTRWARPEWHELGWKFLDE